MRYLFSLVTHRVPCFCLLWAIKLSCFSPELEPPIFNNKKNLAGAPIREWGVDADGLGGHQGTGTLIPLHGTHLGHHGTVTLISWRGAETLPIVQQLYNFILQRPTTSRPTGEADS